MSTTIELEALSDLVALALEEDMKGGTIRVNVQGQSAGIFGNTCPRSGKAVEGIAKAAQSAILLDWAASGRKEARTYDFTIRDKDQNIRTQRVFSFAPEEVTAKDLQDQALSTSLLAIQGAQATIREPYELLRDQLVEERKRSQADHEEIRSLRERMRQLETDRQVAVDEVSALRRTQEGAELARAQADALRIEATGKAKAWNDIGQAAVANSPMILSLGARLLGLGPAGKTLPPGAAEAAARMAGAMGAPPQTPAPAPAPIVGARGYTPPPKPMSGEALAEVRRLAQALTNEEISRLCKFAWDSDPDLAVLPRLFAPERADSLFVIAKLVAGGWGLS